MVVRGQSVTDFIQGQLKGVSGIKERNSGAQAPPLAERGEDFRDAVNSGLSAKGSEQDACWTPNEETRTRARARRERLYEIRRSFPSRRRCILISGHSAVR